MERMQLPRGVQEILRRLRAVGHRGDIVGGCVRDFLLGKAPHDFDMTTDATPEQMREVFRDLRTVDTGIRHGTLTVLWGREPYEVTTYRVDGTYADCRHPDAVIFTRRLEEDLARRDFTMNAIAYNPEDGFTDPFGGEADIRAKTVRAVGDPYVRFGEDALRILRAVRFASQLDFSIEAPTRVSVFQQKDLLRRISAERVFAEWRKLLGGVAARQVLAEYAGLWPVFLPEIAGVDPEKIRALPTPCEPTGEAGEADILFFVLFALSPGKPTGGDFARACERLHSDAHLRELGRRVLDIYGEADIETERDALRALSRWGEEATLAAARVRDLLGLSAGAAETVRRAVGSGTPYRVGKLAIGGRDLLALGIRGAAVGQTLNRLLRAVIDGQIPNERAALLSCAKDGL